MPSASCIRATIPTFPPTVSCQATTNLPPGYATTVPKAQGSEYPAVVVPLVTQMP